MNCGEEAGIFFFFVLRFLFFWSLPPSCTDRVRNAREGKKTTVLNNWRNQLGLCLARKCATGAILLCANGPSLCAILYDRQPTWSFYSALAYSIKCATSKCVQMLRPRQETRPFCMDSPDHDARQIIYSSGETINISGTAEAIYDTLHPRDLDVIIVTKYTERDGYVYNTYCVWIQNAGRLPLAVSTTIWCMICNCDRNSGGWYKRRRYRVHQNECHNCRGCWTGQCLRILISFLSRGM